MSDSTRGKGRQSVWTDEIIQKMLELWMEGKSASTIAKELCAVAGKELSRNAVIGKLHRMRKAGQIPEREETRAQARQQTTCKEEQVHQHAPAPRHVASGSLALETKARPAAMPAARPRPQLEVVAVEEEKGLISDIMDLKPHSCRWPIGNPGEEDFCFCGRESEEGRPYCERHAAVAYQR